MCKGVKDTQWENWNASGLVEKIEDMKKYFMKNENKIKTDVKMQTDLFCLHKNTISDYMTKRKL